MAGETSDLKRQLHHLRTNLVAWILGTVVLVLVVVALMGLSLLGPQAVSEHDKAEEEVSESESSDDDTNGIMSASDFMLPPMQAEETEPTKSDRMQRNAQEQSQQYQIRESHALNRSKSYVLAKTREIDIDAEIIEFAKARKEWDELVQHLLVSDEGKRLSLDRNMIEAFLELYRKRPLRPGWVEAMHGQLDILLEPVFETIEERYSQPPGGDLEGEVKNVAAKATENAGDIKRDISILRGLVARAPEHVPLPTPTLAESIVAFEAEKHSKEFLDERDLKKQAEEEAKRRREEELRQEQIRNLALSKDLKERNARLQEEAARLAEENAKLEAMRKEVQAQRETVEKTQVELEATAEVIEEKVEAKKKAIREALTRSALETVPTKEDLEAGANFSFALASRFGNLDSPKARARGGVVLYDYNALVAPKGEKPCTIWKSEDGKNIFLKSERETLGVRASRVRSIVYPSGE